MKRLLLLKEIENLLLYCNGTYKSNRERTANDILLKLEELEVINLSEE